MECSIRRAMLGIAPVAVWLLTSPASSFGVETPMDVPSAVLAGEKSIRRESQSPSMLERTFERAEELLADGRVRDAADRYEVVAKLADEPLRSRARLKFGYASSILNRPGASAALTSSAQTAIAEPERSEIRTFAVRMLESTEVRPILTAPPKRSSGHAQVALAARPVAKPFWDQVRDIETMSRKGRVTTAVRLYKELLATYPDHPVILNNLALLLADGIDPAESERLVRRALDVPGGEQYVEYLYDTLGLAILRKGRPADSIEHFRRALAMRETADRNLHMAMALDMIGQPDAAEAFRERAGALEVMGTWPTK